MEQASYQSLKVSRGLTYQYYFSKAQADKPTIIFLHGFPTASFIWTQVVDLASKDGYGVLLPDLLGYGGTDKPADPNMYKRKAMAQDMIDIIDHNDIGNAVVFGHDWGCDLTSKLSVYFSDRFLGFAFLAMAYTPPRVDWKELSELSKKICGKPMYEYFASAASDEFVTAVNKDMRHMATVFNAPSSGPPPAEFSQKLAASLQEGGFAGPCSWYKVAVDKLDEADEAGIPPEKFYVNKPALMITCKFDNYCHAEVQKEIMKKWCPDLTLYELEADHFAQVTNPKEVYGYFLKWIIKL